MDPIKVLVVDDEADFVEMLVMRLRFEEMDVIGMTSAVAGLAFLKDNPVDVVILDLRMPEMDGLTAIKEMKARYPFLEIILLTGYPSQESLDAMRAGAFDILNKPTPPGEIVQRILEAFERGRIRRMMAESPGRTLKKNNDGYLESE